MIRVIIESPYAGSAEDNVSYARSAMLDSLRRGEAPFLSHLLYTQVLNDLMPEHRAMGIEAGLLWGEVAERTIVCNDLGISTGMRLGIDAAYQCGRPVVYRSVKVQ